MALHPEINPSPEGLPLSIAAAALRAARASKTSHSGSAYFETGSTADGDGVGIVTGPMAAEHGGIGRLDDDGALHPLVDLEPLKQAAQAAQAQADSVREQAAKDAQTLREQMSKVAADADKASEQAHELAQSALDAANKADGKADTITTTVNGHESKLAELSASLESTRKTADGALEKTTSIEASVGALSATLTRDYTPTSKADAKYAAKTELTTTAEGLQSKITQTAATAGSAVTTANEAKSTADKNTATISQVSKTAQGALDKASSVEQSLDGFKATVSSTYQPKGEYQPKGDYATKTELNQTADSITSSVAKTYQPKGDYATNSALSSYATKTQLEQTANSITSTVSESINNTATVLAANNANYIPNGIPVGSAFKPSWLKIVDGVYQFTRNGGENHVDMGFATLTRELPAGKKYRISLKARIVDGTVTENDKFNFGIERSWASVYATGLTGDWKQYENEFALNASQTGITRFFMSSYLQSAGAKTIQVRNLRLIDLADEQNLLAQVAASIDNLSVGGRNYVRKGDYLKKYYNPTELAYDPDTDTYSITTPETSNPTWGSGIAHKSTTPAVVEWGQWSVLSMWVWADHDCKFKIDRNMYCVPAYGSGNDHMGSVKTNNGMNTVVPTWDIKANTWTKIESYARNNNDASSGGGNPNHYPLNEASAMGFITSGQVVHAKIKHIKFEVGEKATDWTPAPEDLLDKDTASSTYSTKTEVSQTAQGLTARISEVSKTANGAVTTANEAKSTADSNSKTITQLSNTVSGTTSRVSTLEQSLNGFKTTVSSTYQPKGDYATNSGVAANYATKSSLDQTADGIKTEVAQKYQAKGDYATKTELSQTSTSLTAKISTAQNTANTANGTANSAKSQANNLDTLIRMDTNGVRVGKIVSGKYAGCSCLMNANGSFDVIDSDNNIVARLDANSVTLAGGVFNIGVIGGEDLYIGAQPLNMQQYETGLVLGRAGNDALLQGYQQAVLSSPGGNVSIFGKSGVDIDTGAGKLTVNGQVWDSVTLYKSGGWAIVAFGKVVTISANNIAIGGGSWDTLTCPYKLPEQYRPAGEINNAANVTNNIVTRRIYVSADGTIKIGNIGGTGSTQPTYASITYVAV